MSKGILRREVLIARPPEDVWIALTDPRALAEWLMPNNFKPVVGHRFEFQTDPYFTCTGRTECEVLECDPPRRLAYSWRIIAKNPGQSPPAMRVEWTLEPAGDGTRLLFVQTGIDTLPFWMRFSMSMGWGTMLKRWIPKVVGNVKDGVFNPGAIPMNKRCYGTKTIADDMIR